MRQTGSHSSHNSHEGELKFCNSVSIEKAANNSSRFNVCRDA